MWIKEIKVRITLLIFMLALVAIVPPVEAQTQFIKFKKFLIPISSKPNVYYIDDVGDTRQSTIDCDPNGVQELPIVIGWRDIGYYNLVGVGAAAHNNGTASDKCKALDAGFVQNLLTLMGETDITVYSDANNGLRNSIIEKALELGSPSNRMVIAIGGPRNVVQESIDEAATRGTPIKDLIRVIGIQECSESNPANCPVNVDVDTVAAIGSSNHHIVPCYTARKPSCRAFYLNSSIFSYVGNRDIWYNDHYVVPTKIGEYIRTSGLEEEVKDINGGRSLKIADFTALAYLIWGDEIWSTEFETRMYDEIADGLKELP